MIRHNFTRFKKSVMQVKNTIHNKVNGDKEL